MDKEQHEKYEYARKRIKQKKRLYFHFVIFLVGSLFLIVLDKLELVNAFKNWYLWAVVIWFFLFILHFIKVNITDRFLNKEWEREQIDKLVEKQNTKISQLEKKLIDQHQEKKDTE